MGHLCNVNMNGGRGVTPTQLICTLKFHPILKELLWFLVIETDVTDLSGTFATSTKHKHDIYRLNMLVK